MKNYIYFILMALIVIAGFGYFSGEDVQSDDSKALAAVEKADVLPVIKTKQVQKTETREQNVFTEVANMDITNQWEEEFGCFDYNREDNGCFDYSFLSARSLEEAEWMRRQGYPSKSLIEMAKDPSKQDAFHKLLDKNSPTAHTVAALLALADKDTDLASTMALKNRYFSDNSKSFPYRLYGEVLLAQGEKVSAISQFQIAALLGDSQANSIVHGIAAGDAIFASRAMNRAHETLNDMFDVIPEDPRPNPFGDG